MNSTALTSMIRRGALLSASVAAALACSSGAMAVSPQVGDGGFDGKVVAVWGPAAGSWGFMQNRGSAIVGTKASYANLDPSPTGGNFLSMDSDPFYSTTVVQTLTGLTIGQTYEVSFFQAASMQPGYFTGTPVDQYWKVSFGGASQNSSVMSITQGTGYKNTQPVPVQWQQQSLSFLATSASVVLGFMAVGPAGAPPMAFLDGVTVSALTAVPEPSSMLLMFSGALGLMAAARLRQRARAR